MGWVDPKGKSIICVKPKHLRTGYNPFGKSRSTAEARSFHRSHDDCSTSGGKNGDAMFDYLPLADVKRRLVRFIEDHPGITGTIHLDTGGTQPFQEVEVLPLVEALDYLRC